MLSHGETILATDEEVDEFYSLARALGMDRGEVADELQQEEQVPEPRYQQDLPIHCQQQEEEEDAQHQQSQIKEEPETLELKEDHVVVSKMQEKDRQQEQQLLLCSFGPVHGDVADVAMDAQKQKGDDRVQQPPRQGDPMQEMVQPRPVQCNKGRDSTMVPDSNAASAAQNGDHIDDLNVPYTDESQSVELHVGVTAVEIESRALGNKLRKVKDFCYSYNRSLKGSNDLNEGLHCPVCDCVTASMKGILKHLCCLHFKKEIACHHLREVKEKRCNKCGSYFGRMYAARIHFGITHEELTGPFFLEIEQGSNSTANEGGPCCCSAKSR